MVTFAFPYALEAIGWKTYMINATWDVLEVLFIISFWVETSGKTLEEIDMLIDGNMHSDALELNAVVKDDVDLTAGHGLREMNATVSDTVETSELNHEITLK